LEARPKRRLNTNNMAGMKARSQLRRRQTAIFAERAQRVIAESRKLLEQREGQLKQLEQFLEQNPTVGVQNTILRRSVGAPNIGDKFGKVVKEKLVTLFRRFVLLAPSVDRNRGNSKKGELRPNFEWPYVMTSSALIDGPLVSGTWIWHHQHARWHHGYYRTRR